MFLLFTMITWILSMMFVCLNHPLSLGFTLLLQTIMISITSGLLNLNYWFSYILFLIMIGGMLVLFIYMTSVASNEKFQFSWKLLAITILSSIIFILLLMKYSKYMNFFNMKMIDLSNQILLNINLSMSKFMNMPSMIILILIMLYLLITLITIVKITQWNMGPLRRSST